MRVAPSNAHLITLILLWLLGRLGRYLRCNGPPLPTVALLSVETLAVVQTYCYVDFSLEVESGRSDGAEKDFQRRRTLRESNIRRGTLKGARQFSSTFVDRLDEGENMEIRADYLHSSVLAGLASIVLAGCADASSDNTPLSSRFVGVGGDRLVGNEVPIAFDGEAEFAADSREFS
jgi:hypothetical protein